MAFLMKAGRVGIVECCYVFVPSDVDSPGESYERLFEGGLSLSSHLLSEHVDAVAVAVSVVRFVVEATPPPSRSVKLQCEVKLETLTSMACLLTPPGIIT
jgi:hypothetical protein